MDTIHNETGSMVTDMIDGYVGANSALLERLDGTKSILVKNAGERVMILAGGGAGCEPLYIGCAGIRMADAVVSGNIFAAPPATALLKTMKQMYHEKGILMVTGNYVGDVLNYELAVELCGYEGIEARTVFVRDDILHMPKKRAVDRRGTGGILPVIKTAAGAAAEGLELEEVERIARKAERSLGTISVTFGPGCRPETGESMYEMQRGYIEFGMGFNGEPGIRKMKMPSADQLAGIILNDIIEDMELREGMEVALMVNGKGATSNMELYILTRSLIDCLENKKIKIFNTETGNFFTAPGMRGVSVTVMRLDEELKRYYHQDSYTPMYAYSTRSGMGAVK